MKTLASMICAALLTLLAGCSEPEFPRDPEDTLVLAVGGVLRVGAAAHAPHVEVSDDGAVSGPEADVMLGYAESIDAEIEWVEGAESELMELLKLGQIDAMIGGLTGDSPWTSHAALTRPYAKTTGPDGKEVKLVLATRLGENALLSSLERYLIDEGLKP